MLAKVRRNIHTQSTYQIQSKWYTVIFRVKKKNSNIIYCLAFLMYDTTLSWRSGVYCCQIRYSVSTLRENSMATHSSALTWEIPWMEDPGRLQSMGSWRVRHDWATSLYSHFHALEKETATHSSVLAWRIPGTGAWWAAGYGVAQSQTRLTWLSSSSSDIRSNFMNDNRNLKLMHSLSPYHYSYSFHESVIPTMGSQWQKLVGINCLHYSINFIILCCFYGR